jgi:hypothetical protein
MIATTLGVASLAVIFGPFIVLQSIAVVNTLSFMMSHDRSRRLAILACGAVTMLLPIVLEVAGVFPPAYEFRDDTLIVLANAVHFPPIATRAFIVVASLTVIVSSALLIARMRDILTIKERQLHLQTWQLRQLVPEEASAQIPLPPLPASCRVGERRRTA